ncbi:Transposon Tf2-8 polyprotein [Nosema granulosis]|uniref:Transposon Tf2-8 polyprotein n=1 Tax=Nosema granulosis TaxID=83296 RepID=A0A9P6KY22_9MICR|nr:Transposon Tf2-8 polyprotein [Nosema granulosis]
MLNLLISEKLTTKISDKRTFDTRLDTLGELILNPNEYHTYLDLMKGAQRRQFPDVIGFISFIRECKIRADLCNKNDKISEREVTDVLIKSLSKREKDILMSNEARTLTEIKDVLQKASYMMSFYRMDESTTSYTSQSNMTNSNHVTAIKQYCLYHKSPFHSTQDCRAKGNSSEKEKRKSQNLTTTSSKINQNQIMTEIEISNKLHTFLVDTGSQDNFISESLADTFTKSIKKCEKHITLAKGKSEKVNRKISHRFKLPSMQQATKEDFYIITNLPQKGLIGLKLLKKYGYNIDCVTGKLQRANHNEIQSPASPDEDILDKVDSMYTEQCNENKFLTPFINSNPKLGCIKGHKMTLPLKDDVPVNKKPYPVPIKHLPKLKEEVKKLADLKIIHDINSNYSSPAFTVPKKAGDIRLVVDYRELNKKPSKWAIHFYAFNTLLWISNVRNTSHSLT